MDYTQYLLDLIDQQDQLILLNGQIIDSITFNSYLLIFLAGIIIALAVVIVLKGLE